ncbi:MAG TPA: hypothetical protein VHF22_00705 [Planctomycetota bacterium]|nr:hypothetical protein [Planctomycetota bacterium]
MHPAPKTVETSAPNLNGKRFLTADEAAAYLGMRKSAFHERVDAGLFPQPCYPFARTVAGAEVKGDKRWDFVRILAAADKIAAPSPAEARADELWRAALAEPERARRGRAGRTRREA